MLLISRTEVETLLELRSMLQALERGFVEFSAGRTSTPPRVGAFSAKGLLAAMPGYVPGAGLAAKLVSVFPGNHGAGIPSHQALIALFDEDDGHPTRADGRWLYHGHADRRWGGGVGGPAGPP